MINLFATADFRNFADVTPSTKLALCMPGRQIMALACAIGMIAVATQTHAIEDAEIYTLGEPQTIEADVGDSADIDSLSLHYRFRNASDLTSPKFTSMAMQPVSNGGVYAATVDTQNIEADVMEFYLVGESDSGERLLKGSAFEPLTRILVTASDATAQQSEQSLLATNSDISEDEAATSSKSWNIPRYAYYALGVLAVGAIAAASQSGGGSSASDECSDEGCNLTITLSDP